MREHGMVPERVAVLLAPKTFEEGRFGPLREVIQATAVESETATVWLSGRLGEPEWDILDNSVMLIILGWDNSDQAVRDLQKARRNQPLRPILAVGISNDVNLRSSAIEHGADNYLRPDCSETELKAKFRRLNRLSTMVNLERAPICVGDLQIWPDVGIVLRDGEPIKLSAREIAVLACLARSAPAPVSRRMLEREAFGLASSPGTNVVAVHMHRLRKKIEADTGRSYLRTVQGMGYSLT